MNGIQKQNTRQAMQILNNAKANRWEVRVSKEGTIRIASWADRLKSEFTAFINPSRTRTDWVEKAKLAIHEKLKSEISLFQKNFVSNDNLQSLINDLQNTENENLKKNLEALWHIKDKKIYGLILEQSKDPHTKDFEQAHTVANYANRLIKNNGLGQNLALSTARKMHLFEKQNLAKEFNELLRLVLLTGRLVRTHNINTNDAILCLKVAKSIEKERQITTEEAMEFALKGLDKIKGAIESAPSGCTLNFDHSTTVISHKFSENGENLIINYLKNPKIAEIDSNNLNTGFIGDSNRQKYVFKSKDGIAREYDYNSANYPGLDFEVSKKNHQQCVSEELKKFCDEDDDLACAMSFIADQSAGNAFAFAFAQDLDPINNTKYVFLSLNDKTTNKAIKHDFTTLSYNERGNIEVHYKARWKLNLIHTDSNHMIFVKNIGQEYELEGEYTAEYEIDKLRKAGNEIREKLNETNAAKKTINLTHKPEPKIISPKLDLNILPDWNRIIIGEMQ